METQQALVSRRSVRRYTDQPIPLDAIKRMIDAARLAPTARNIQPWEFVVVTQKDLREKIADITEYGKFIAQAPACIAVFCKDTKYYLEDGSAATQNILLSAWAQGIGSCWVAGDKKPYCWQINHLLAAPDEYRLISLIALGYPDESPKLRKRSRGDVLHLEKF